VRSDDGAASVRTVLRPVRPGGPVLVHALSGLGKSTLAAAHPGRVLDADRFLYEALEGGFPALGPRQRVRAWRELCRQHPWVEGGEALARWATIRRGFTGPLVAAMRGSAHALVLTSLRDPPWHVSAYYGVERGRYVDHLAEAGRRRDNHQSEAMNDRLEGYAPLVRLAPGTFLGERDELLAVIAGGGT